MRVAFIAGGLWRGGAEKQLLYMIRALVARGVDVRCYCLTRGDAYEAALGALGVRPIWIGRPSHPVFRLVHLAWLMADYRPHVVQSSHFFTNLYAAIGARACGALSIGAIRNDTVFELRENGRWGPWLLRLPTVLVANSTAGRDNARLHRRQPDAVTLLSNVIDLDAFDAVTTDVDIRDRHQVGPIVLGVGRLVRAKRFDRLLAAIARARFQVPELQAVIVGDGPEREALQAEAARLGLGDVVRFLGSRSDVPAIMRQASVFALSSDHEGFPNVVLEAMAAQLPVVATPAGDAAAVLVDGVTGHVVAADDVNGFADRLAELALSPTARRTMGRAGRQRVEQLFGAESLADRLIEIYERDGRQRWPAYRQVPMTDAAAARRSGARS